MRGWSLLLVMVLSLACGPAWAKGHGRGQGGKPAVESTPPAGARPPGLARQDKTPKGLEKQGKTPEGWSHGKKKGWLDQLFGRKDEETSESKPEKPQKPQKTQ